MPDSKRFGFLRLATMAGTFTMVVGCACAQAEPVTLETADKVKIFGDYAGGGDKSKTLILLFHMAGANAGEYATIAPKLVALGFNTLAIDQRSGGTDFGRANRTAKAYGRPASYMQALPDLQAALDWARTSGHTGKVIAWGSSYSAALVFLLAAGNPGKVAGLLAFSPGEYLGGKNTVRAAAAKLVGTAVFVSSASDPAEIGAARSIFDAVPDTAKTLLVPKNAPHGSSALRDDANPKGNAEVWAAVTRFLEPLR